MEVRVLSHMPFAGKQRKPGDLIPEDVWLGATDTVRASLINGGFVRVGGDGAQASESEASTDTIELLQGISAKQDRILGMMETVLSAAGVKAPPVKKARKKPAAKKPRK